MLRRVVYRRLKLLLLIAGGLATLLLTTIDFNPWVHQAPSASLLNHAYFHYNLTAEEPLDPHQDCTFPRFHPLHPSVWKYLKEPRIIQCRNRMPLLSYIDEWGVLKLNYTELTNSGYEINGSRLIRSLKCYWSPVVRGEPGNPSDDFVTYGEQEPLLLEGVSLTNIEVVKVSCTNFAGLSIYEMMHVHPHNTSSVHIKRKTDNSHHSINVFIFGIDSMSRLAFIRLLPNTYKYITETLLMRVYRGMNKIGDNTYPNLIALLTGERAYGSSLPSAKDGYDDWPLIWKNYSSAGYVTLWAEDFPNFGLFNYLAKGFHRPPTNHYLRPFWLAVRDSSTLRKSSHMCFGPTPKHQLQMNYLLRFIQKYEANKSSDVPFFGFSFLAELSHEYISQVGAADMDFVEFFRKLNEEGHLQNTLLIVTSDHGHRFDAIRSTEVGRIEERLPFFAIHVPETLLKENLPIKHNIDANKGRLITPYDVHATLLDLLNYVKKDGFSNLPPVSRYGKSLFRPIPANRTCIDAGIPPHYCTCEPETTISIGDPRVRASVRVLFRRVNFLLRTVREFCVELFPGVVKSAYLIVSTTKDVMKTTRKVQKIRVTVEAEPSKAIFEATLAISFPEFPEKGSITPPIEAKVLGDISRTNKYGEQSSCIKHDILRKYCFCQQIRTNKSNLHFKRRSYGNF